MAQVNIGGYQENQRSLAPFIEFFIDSEEDRVKSLENGRLTMRDVDMVRVRQRGSKDYVEKPVAGWLKEMRAYSDEGHQPAEWADLYEAAYKKWKAGEDGPVKGFDLRNWGGINKAQVENLRSMGILSVEEVAEMNESTMNRIGMGSRALKNRAMEWVRSMAGKINTEEVAQLRGTVEAQNQQIEDLRQQIAKLGGKTK
jgi:hypothetical protein